jgi:hypothetical protein
VPEFSTLTDSIWVELQHKRAEDHGFTYERPDFGLDAQHSNVTTHTTQLSAGIVFRF